MTMHRACSASDVGLGRLLRVVVAGQPICVVCTETGELYAIDDTCTHEKASLSEGQLVGTVVECPAHGSMFDATTGEAVGPPADKGVRIFAVVLEGEDVILEA